MPDVVVTVPKSKWAEWLEEGDLAYEDDSGHPTGWAGEYQYGFVVPSRPRIKPGELVYVVAHGRLRGYAPLVFEPSTDVQRFGYEKGWALVRMGGAVAVTIPVEIQGFQGFRYRWWRRDMEVPFPDWRKVS